MVANLIDILLGDILFFLHQGSGYSLFLAFFFMYFYFQCEENGLKNTIRLFINKLNQNSKYGKVFFAGFIVSLIVFRTLLNRDAWSNPLQNVVGYLWIINSEGEIVKDVLENIILFIPLSFSILLIEGHLDVKRVLCSALKCSFCFSLVIECSQIVLRVGQFQLSDLLYNSFGGVIGGLLYLLYVKVIKHRR